MMRDLWGLWIEKNIFNTIVIVSIKWYTNIYIALKVFKTLGRQEVEDKLVLLTLFFTLVKTFSPPPPFWFWKIIVWSPHNIEPRLDFVVFKMSMTKWLGRFQVITLSRSLSSSLCLCLLLSPVSFYVQLSSLPQSWPQLSYRVLISLSPLPPPLPTLQSTCPESIFRPLLASTCVPIIHIFRLCTCPKMDKSNSTWIVWGPHDID